MADLAHQKLQKLKITLFCSLVLLSVQAFNELHAQFVTIVCTNAKLHSGGGDVAPAVNS